MGWMTEVRFLTGARNSFLRHYVQTDSGAHPASNRMLGLFSWGQRGQEVKMTTQYLPTAEIMKTWSYKSTPPYVLWYGV